MFAVRVLPLGGMTSVSISIKESNQLKAVAPSGEKKIDVSIFRPDGSGFNHMAHVYASACQQRA